MREAKTIDVLLLILLGAIWGSAFFNIKIATYTYDPITLVFVRVFFALVALGIYCVYKNIRILAFSKNWKMYALVGLTNITIPFLLIAYGTNVVDSYLSAILMSTTPLSGTLLAHFFTSNEKLNIFKSIGVLVGFLGVVFLFFDKLVISDSNIFYVIVAILLFKIIISEKKIITILIYLFLITLFASLIISFDNINRPDAGLYHLPYIKIIQENKIILGLTNIHFRFGTISIIQYLSAIYNNSIMPIEVVSAPVAILVSSIYMYFLSLKPKAYKVIHYQAQSIPSHLQLILQVQMDESSL